jgi:hypothetical protein
VEETVKKHRDYRLPKYAAERERFDKVRFRGGAAAVRSCTL